MTLFLLLLILAWERLFKQGPHWQLEFYLNKVFVRLTTASLWQTLLMTLIWTGWVALFFILFRGVLYGALTFVLIALFCLLCIGAGEYRQAYKAYLQTAIEEDKTEAKQWCEKITAFYPYDAVSLRNPLVTLQNNLLWLNYRFYLAPLFWLLLGTTLTPLFGALFLAVYAFLRAYQGYLAAEGQILQRANSGVDACLHVLDWIPVRLAGVGYALLGHGERALPAWIASLGDVYSPPYQVLSRLAQFSLAREPHDEWIDTPRIAVQLAKKVTLLVVVFVAILTIFGVVH